jgi:hypothetical protein
MKKALPIILFITIHFLSLNAQEGDRKIIQFIGKLSDELRQPLPYAHILILNNYRGTITDRSGKFSLVVQEKDSVMFASLGYKRKYIEISDTFSDPLLSLNILLDRDTLTIPEIVIYPWKTYDEFKEAFINLKLPDDDMERARKNIALLKTQIILDEEPDARENFNYILKQQYQKTFQAGMYPTYQIFNAFAWAEFFKALKRGDFKKQAITDE